MIIESVELKNFRNYDKLKINFDKNINILYGDNAQGKTNILEALYLSGTSKSHRSNQDKDMIQFEKDEAHIRTVVLKNDLSYQIDMHLKKNKSKGIAINKIPIKKAANLFEIVNYVFFSPEDLNIIKNGPSQRRRFIDLLLCQMDKLYLYDLSKYNKILNNRNRLLKDIQYKNDLMDTLSVWDMQLLEYGKKIMQKRKDLIKNINFLSCNIHKKLTGEKEELLLHYEPSIQEDEFYETLLKNREKDIKFKNTSIGPHRDDILFQINQIDIRKYGSQGQQRTAALSLKLSEIELVKKYIKNTPILLLDDVLSELDANRQTYLLDCINDIQTIITCTGLDDFVNNRFHIDRLYKVVNGNVFEKN